MQCITGIGLRGLLAEAVQALVALDAERLDELLCSLKAMRVETGVSGRIATDHAAVTELAHLGRIVAATRANLAVVGRSARCGGATLEYNRPDAPNGVAEEICRGYN